MNTLKKNSLGLFLLILGLATPLNVLAAGSPDLDGNGRVNIFDYNILITNFNKTGSKGFSPADIDTNGKVDIFDYNILVSNFGRTIAGGQGGLYPSTTTSTPTPTPRGGSSQRVYTITSGADDYNLLCNDTSDLSKTFLTVGARPECATQPRHFADMVFKNIQLAKNAPVTNAYLEIVPKSSYTNPLTLRIDVYAAGGSRSMDWTLQNWTANVPVRSPSLASAIQTLVTSSSWTSGQKILVRVTFKDNSGTGTRGFFSYEGGPSKSAKLAISSSSSSITQAASPTPTRKPPTPTTRSSILTPTKTPTPQAGTQRMYSITSGADDYNLLCNDTSDLSKTFLTVGARPECATQPRHFADMDFKNIQLPKNAMVSNAYLEILPNNTYTNPLTLRIDVYAAGGLRSMDWTLQNWTANVPVRSPSLASAIQTLVTSSSWTSGQKILVRVTFKDNSGTGTRGFFSYEGGTTKAAKLVIVSNP